MELFKIPEQFEHDGITYPGTAVSVDSIEKIKAFKSRTDDVLIATYPRSGTTWMIEIVYVMLKNGDMASAKATPPSEKCYYLEHNQVKSSVDVSQVNEQDSYLTKAENIEGSRLLKTHLRMEYLENQIVKDKLKTIVVMRNPKDQLISLFHFYRTNKFLGNFNLGWDRFFDLCKQNALIYGSWLDHVMGYWKLKDLENVLVVKYEDMISDIMSTLKQIAKFLNKSDSLSEEQFQNIAKHVSFREMQKNPMTNYSLIYEDVFNKDIPHIRQGTVGQWKQYFTEKENKFIQEQLIEKAEQQGLKFSYSLDSTNDYSY